MPPTLEDAIRLAAFLHAGESDKSDEPYILHPLAVMLDRSLTTEVERMTAVLHDTVEDCGITVDFIRKRGYPGSVVEALEYLTKRPEEEAADGDSRDERERKYAAYIERVASGPPLVRKVKLADLRHNADLSRFKSPSRWDIERTEKYTRAIARLEAAS